MLFGDADPAGRLTVSVPRSVGEVPIYYNHLNTGRPRSDPQVPDTNSTNSYYVTGYLDEKDGPLYPFGHGLTYTTFDYSAVKVDASTLSAALVNDGKAHLTVSADIRKHRAEREAPRSRSSTSGFAGDELSSRPIRELKGFQRVRLAAGESRRLEFTLGKDELSFWNIDMKDVAEPGALYVWVAPDSAQGSPAMVTLTE